jgi:hypothetical protein
LRRSVKDQQSKYSTIQERIPSAKLSFFQGCNTRSSGRKERKTCNNFEESEYRGQRRRRREILGVFRVKKKPMQLEFYNQEARKKHDIERPSKGAQRDEQETLLIIETNFFFTN